MKICMFAALLAALLAAPMAPAHIKIEPASASAYQKLTFGVGHGCDVTYADSVITDNRALPASVGKRQPRVPDWRANALASMRVGQHWTASLGLRCSGRQFSALDNLDTHDDTYMGVSDYLVTDVRLRYRFDRQRSAAVGIDNLGNTRYWAFHPYPQRTMLAEVRFDY